MNVNVKENIFLFFSSTIGRVGARSRLALSSDDHVGGVSSSAHAKFLRDAEKNFHDSASYHGILSERRRCQRNNLAASRPEHDCCGT